MSWVCRFTGILSLVLFSSGLLSAQSSVATASLNGTITDPSGASIVGAKVAIRDSETGFVRQTVTTDAGLYSLTDLPVGTYELTVEQPGFNTAVRNNIRLAVGAVSTLNIQMEVGTATQKIDVSTEAPLVETSRSETSTAISNRQIQELPINGRNFLDFTLLTPGVVRDPTRTGDLSFGGQRGTSNSLLIDGSDANNTFYGQSTGRTGTGRNPYSFSEDAVQEFQVNTNGYAPEIGRAGGGVINTITKSGTNAVHGDAFEFFRDKALNANSWDNNALGRPKRAYHFNQFGGSIGGPIIRNKAFFFFDYDGQRNTTPNTVAPGVLPAPTDIFGQSVLPSLQQYFVSYANSLNNDVYLGKVDWNLTNNQHITFRYNANRFKGLNYENAGATSAVGHTGNSNVSTDNAGAIYTASIGPNKVFEGRFFYTRDYEPGLANSNTPETIIQQSGTTVISFGRNSFSPRSANIDTFQPTAIMSIVKGSHTLRFGADFIFQQIANFFPGNFGGSFTFTSYDAYALNQPASFTQAFAGPGTTGATVYPNVNEYAGFVQDSWRVSRKLTVNYGLRYDYFNYAQPPVLNPDPNLAAMNIKTNRIHIDPADWGPRFAVAYSPNEDGKTVIRAGYGIFYAVTPSIFTGTAFTQNGIQVQSFTFNTPSIPVTYPNVLPGIPTGANRVPSLFVFSNNFSNPRTQQWNFNLERQLGNNYAVTLGYLGLHGLHLPRTRDINLLPAVPVSDPIQGGGSFVFYRHRGRPNPGYGRIWLADSGADSSYNGAFIQFAKRFSHNFVVQTSYTWSHAIDDDPDATAVVFGTDDTKIVQNNLLPNLDRGNANADIRHRFVFSGVLQTNFLSPNANPFLRAIVNGWEISTLANVQSGRPYTSTIGQVSDLNNDGNLRDDRTPYQGRNVLRGPNFMTDDVRLSRFFPLGSERFRLQIIGEAFNVTNRVNFISLRTTQYNFTGALFVPVNTFLTPAPGSAAGDPRILQLAAKIFF
ncbi:MAG TPA: carboxypeptidase regulatory-like domain-containing protein [Bryobacteraceae bacterium]|nr:carboxypeptidase regulatory-like domain-containing protein [Bryobacteraceae bacterium]